MSKKAYQAKIALPCAVLGVRTEDDYLVGLEFLSPRTKPQEPVNAVAREVKGQIEAYLKQALFVFDLPLSVEGTLHQKAVWMLMRQIPAGYVRTYGDVAKQLKSSPRAVGQACGANPVPVVIPCHRIIGKGSLGGFMNASAGNSLDIKRWLLSHEQQ